MTPKRPRRARLRSSEPSSSSSDATHKRLRTAYSPSPSEPGGDPLLRVHLVQAKLSPESVIELYQLIESCSGTIKLELCPEVEDADIIVTAVRMKRRLERHVEWGTAKQKAIVTPDWLRNSIKAGHALPCEDFAAIGELQEETTQDCPQFGDCGDSNQGPRDLHSNSENANPTSPRVLHNWRARYACQRASPVKCPNQGLAEALSVLCRDRELEGLFPNALAYQRAVAIIKSYPQGITEENLPEVSKLPGLGGKIFFKVEEYIAKGFIPEVKETLASERYQALSTFATIYGIGPNKAQQFYDMGMRSLSDLDRYFDISPPPFEGGPSSASSIKGIEQYLRELDDKDNEVIYTPNGRRVPDRKRSKRRENPPDINIPIALVLRDEFDIPIPRAEVEEIRDVVMRELNELQPGCICTIVGGYRRGKPESSDADIVFTHSDSKNGAEIVRGLCTKLTTRLYRKARLLSGLITHVMRLSGFHAYNALRTEHWDQLEKSLTVFRLSSTPTSGPRLHRRLDLIFAIPASYWTAVIGWTGSKMFQRDLRLWAKQEKGMKFDSNGLTRRHDTRSFLTRSEQEVFDILGLDWVDPTMRNADA